MARLSNSVRESMATALVKHRFAAPAAELIAECKTLYHTVYDQQHTPAIRKHMDALTKLYKGAFTTDASLDVNVSGRRLSVGSRSIGKHWRCEVERLPMLNGIDSYPGIGFASDDTLGARLVAFADAEKKLGEDVAVAQREALGALGQFSTGKKLAAEWPEAMPVIGSLIPEDDRTLPVVQVAHLNSKFDLPPNTAIAA